MEQEGLLKLFWIIQKQAYTALITPTRVSANYRNNGHHGDRLKLFQASIYDMPFPNNSFDKVFCFGVLQHTPDFEKSVKSLIDKVAPDGELVVDFYPVYGWWTKLHAKYLLRPWTKKMPHEKLLKKIEKNSGWMIGLTSFLNKIGIGKFVNRFIPVCDIKGTLPANLSKEELKEWVILDTFDMYSPSMIIHNAFLLSRAGLKSMGWMYHMQARSPMEIGLKQQL